MHFKENPITSLGQLVQEDFGQNISFEIEKDGPEHVPTITAIVTLPDGRKYTGSGKNQKLARKSACEKALKNYYNGEEVS